MATWQVIVNGTTYSLSDNNPFKLLGISGIGNAPVRRLDERGPFQDGSTDIGYRLDARLINLNIQILATSLSNADTHRDTLSAIFNPRNGQTIQLRCTRDDGAVRQIDCYAVNMVDMPAELSARSLAAQRVALQLKAPNPIWYNPTATVTPIISNISNWYLAGGLIGTADVFTHSENIAAGGTVWADQGTINAQSPYSIVVRSAGRSAANDVLFMHWYADNAGGQWFRATGGGTIIHASSYGDYPALVSAGTATYFFVSDGMDVRLYENRSLIMLLPGVGALGISSAGSSTWGKQYNNSAPWDSPIAYAAVYAKQLSATERSVLQYVTDNSDFTNSIVNNAGTWDEYPVITLTGPLNDPIVRNATTGDVLDFTGSTVSASQFYIIDCRYGYKTVIDSGAVNRIDKLTDDSDLATFHIAPGANVIGVSASGTAVSSAVNITHYERYMGL